MQRWLIGAMMFLAGVPAALPDDAAFCLLLNRVAAERKLGDYTDELIETGLCMASNAMSAAGAGKDPPTEQLCVLSISYLSDEFRRRFPGKNPDTARAQCEQQSR